MAPRPIQSRLIVDECQFLAVITCLDCPSWREARPTRASALVAGARHLKATHADPYAARRVQYLAARGN